MIYIVSFSAENIRKFHFRFWPKIKFHCPLVSYSAKNEKPVLGQSLFGRRCGRRHYLFILGQAVRLRGLYAWDMDTMGETGITDNDRRLRHPQCHVLTASIVAVRQHLWWSIWMARRVAIRHYWIQYWTGRYRWRKISESVWFVFFVDRMNSNRH